jgi:sarcosine oxidase gamma subunit
MFDRSAFWSPPPDWRHARLDGPDLRITASAPPAVWRLSGRGVPAALARIGLARAVGPREACDPAVYALRVAPDSVLLVGDAATTGVEDAPDTVCSALGDGIIIIDVVGPAAPALMSLGSEHRFDGPPGPPLESARMLFAGLPVLVMRRGEGWRLHIERPWAPALWRWLAGHTGHCGEGAV